jgi:hypothetical protein
LQSLITDLLQEETLMKSLGNASNNLKALYVGKRSTPAKFKNNKFMLDLLLFYVFFESILIPMLCGAEHLIFVARSTASAGALCSKPFRADLNFRSPCEAFGEG